MCQGVWDFCRAGSVLPSLGYRLTLSAASYSGLAESDRDRLHCSPQLERPVLWQRSPEYPRAQVGQASLGELDAGSLSEVRLLQGGGLLPVLYASAWLRLGFAEGSQH